MATARAAGDAGAYCQRNLAFHDALMDMVGHRKAAQIYDTPLEQARQSRREVLSQGAMMQESEAEHAAIVETIAAGDAERARGGRAACVERPQSPPQAAPAAGGGPAIDGLGMRQRQPSEGEDGKGTSR